MEQTEWDCNFEYLLMQIAKMVRNGLPAEGGYLPPWRWQLDITLMHSLTNQHDFTGYQQTARFYVESCGRPLPEISMDELPVLTMLEHGLCRPVLTDEQVIRLAYSPRTMLALWNELCKVKWEWGEMWDAAMESRQVQLPPRLVRSAEGLRAALQEINQRAEQKEAAENAEGGEDKVDRQGDDVPDDPK